MMVRRACRTGVGLMLAAALAAGCASTAPKPVAPVEPVAPPPAAPAPEPPKPPPGPSATPGLSGRQRIRLALDLLGQGRSKAPQARAELQAFLAEQPDNALGRSLLEQIDRDPLELLGAQSFPYTIRSGETLSSLAERFLGDRFQFFALSRYNGLETPREAQVGQVVKIPGTSPPPPALRGRRKPSPAAARASDEALIAARVKEAPEPAAKPPPPAPPPKPAAPRDPGRAGRLRASALALLNKGQADKAAAMLQEAAQLEPGNALIRADLARALRLRGAR